MEPFREALSPDLWKRIERKLGREEALRLLWPALAGPQLAALAEMHGIRGATLILSVTDREWRSPLQSMEKMILDAVNRFRPQSPATAIEFVVHPRPVAPPAVSAGLRKQDDRSMRQQDVLAGAIGDEGLREIFVRSARKYFARRQGG